MVNSGLQCNEEQRDFLTILIKHDIVRLHSKVLTELLNLLHIVVNDGEVQDGCAVVSKVLQGSLDELTIVSKSAKFFYVACQHYMRHFHR